MRRNVCCFSILTFILLGIGQSWAVPITPSDFSGSETLIDFDSFTGGTVVSTQFAGVGAVFNSVQTLDVGASFLGDSDPIVLLNSPTRIIEIDFSVPVNRVGAFISHRPGRTITLSAFDSSNQLIEDVSGSFAVPPGRFVPEGYLGLETSVDISRVTFADSGTDFVIDNLRFEGQQAIPEPSTYLLFGLGLLAFIGIGYCQRKRAVSQS